MQALRPEPKGLTWEKERQRSFFNWILVDNEAKFSPGFVVGYGAACDAYHLTAPSPDGQGLRQAIAYALETSKKASAEINFVNAHGTATLDNDRVEAITLDQMLPGVPFLSTKGHTGHALGAAGAIEAVLTIICLYRAGYRRVQAFPWLILSSLKCERI